MSDARLLARWRATTMRSSPSTGPRRAASTGTGSRARCCASTSWRAVPRDRRLLAQRLRVRLRGAVRLPRGRPSAMRYSGCDISAEMVDAARERIRARSRTLHDGAAPPDARRLRGRERHLQRAAGPSTTEWRAHMHETLDAMDRASPRAASRSTASRPIRTPSACADHLYYADPVRVFDQCKRRSRERRRAASRLRAVRVHLLVREGAAMKKLLIFGTGDIGELAHWYFTHDATTRGGGLHGGRAYVREEPSFCGPAGRSRSRRRTRRTRRREHDCFVAMSYAEAEHGCARDKYRGARRRGYGSRATSARVRAC